MVRYEDAIKAFKKSIEMNSEDSQCHYNLGLSYFKEEEYVLATEHLKICTTIDPYNFYAYNNLAFIYNMHQYYQETINVCNTAKTMMDRLYKEHHNKFSLGKAVQTGDAESLSGTGDDAADYNHTCHRHWAFALFKKGDMSKATKKIKKAINIDPKDADNWITWGLIMRVFGNYKSAMHKFKQAIALEPRNKTALDEINLLQRIMILDSQLTLDQCSQLKLMRPNIKNDLVKPGSFADIEEVSANGSRFIREYGVDRKGGYCGGEMPQ